MLDSRLVVFVHGAWHGAWCWAPLQAELDQRGIASLAVDLPGHGASTLPLGGIHDDAGHVATVLDRLNLDDRPNSERGVVLVGHSYGGAVITQAAAGRDDVAHLVYLAAFALDAGESVTGSLRSLEQHEVALSQAITVHDDGTCTLDPLTAPAALYNSCSPEVAAAAVLRLGAQPMATLTEAIESSARDHIASTYLRCLADHAVHPDHQAVFAQRCTTHIDLDTDHSPFASATDQVADVLVELASS